MSAAPADGFSSWATQLRKGIVELMVLQLVDTRQLYGYAIVRELKERGELAAGEGTVYPILRRLEADGLVATGVVDSGNVYDRPAATYDRFWRKGRTSQDWNTPSVTYGSPATHSLAAARVSNSAMITLPE